MDKSEQKENENVAHVFVFESCFFLFVNEVWCEIFKEEKRRESVRESNNEVHSMCVCDRQ